MLDKNEQFVITTITREAIADLFNDAITNNDLTIPRFTGTDWRLIRLVCLDVAECIADIDSEDFDEEQRVDARNEAILSILTARFSSGDTK